MNVDKKKDRPLLQRTVESGCIPFCRELLLDFSAVCSPYCLCCSISVRLSPSCRMLSGRWKSWVSGSNPGGMQSGFSPCTAHFTIRRECPATASVHPFPRLGGRLSAGTGKFFKEPRSLLPVATWLRIFSYQTVDKTLAFHFLRAALELPTGQYWPRGNICLGGSLCRKLKKKR